MKPFALRIADYGLRIEQSRPHAFSPFLPFSLSPLLLLLLLTGCEKKAPPPPPPPPAVTVALPTHKAVAVYGEYVGLVDSPRTIELVVRVEGVLKDIHFQEGSEVE